MVVRGSGTRVFSMLRRALEARLIGLGGEVSMPAGRGPSCAPPPPSLPSIPPARPPARVMLASQVLSLPDRLGGRRQARRSSSALHIIPGQMQCRLTGTTPPTYDPPMG